MDEDKLYIELFLAGDKKAFEILVRKYQDRGLNIVYSLIGKDRESEDILQEVFLKVYRSLGSFKHRSQFSTWFYRIIVNTCYDFLRRRKGIINDTRFLEESVSPVESAKEALMKLENDALIQKAINGIPLRYRSAMVLKDIEGLSYIEISKVLGCSIGTVESKIYRARKFLKNGLLEFEKDSI